MQRRRDIVGPTGPEADPAEKTPRRATRNRVLKRARIVSDGGVFDCLVLDISAHGARVNFSFPVPLPTEVMLRLPEGTTYPATKRWSVGTEVGLEFTGAVIARHDAIQSRRAEEVYRSLQSAKMATCLEILESERYFGDQGLRLAAEAAAAALDRFAAALLPHLAAKDTKPPDGAR